MTEESKYYTPSIEEFHVGFEYEINTQHPHKNIDGSGWVKISITKGNYHLNMDVINNIERTRVKYLDREDIEELGWLYDNNSEPIPARQDIPFELPLAFCFDTQNINGKCWILYLYKDGVAWVDYIFNCGGEGYIFKGTIKNKSELKKLMKQLGI